MAIALTSTLGALAEGSLVSSALEQLVPLAESSLLSASDYYSTILLHSLLPLGVAMSVAVVAAASAIRDPLGRREASRRRSLCSG